MYFYNTTDIIRKGRLEEGTCKLWMYKSREADTDVFYNLKQHNHTMDSESC